jgi:flagellar basal-body rod protein FlgF
VERGLYIAASGMLADQVRQDVIANNLANANTAGFKGDRAVASAFASMLIQQVGNTTPIGQMGLGVRIDGVSVDYSQGGMRATQNQLDLAIAGEGWFAVKGPGGVQYTRNGAFSLNAERELVTADGRQVLGVGGAAVRVPEGRELGIGADGAVTVDGKKVGALQIAVLDPKSLQKQGSDAVTGKPADGPAGRVAQGFLEAANVNSVREMVGLIATMRSFESSQKAVHGIDETLGKAVNEVGRM